MVCMSWPRVSSVRWILAEPVDRLVAQALRHQHGEDLDHVQVREVGLGPTGITGSGATSTASTMSDIPPVGIRAG
jgi:hypothetical protein